MKHARKGWAFQLSSWERNTGGVGTKAILGLTSVSTAVAAVAVGNTGRISPGRPLAYSTLADLVHHVRQHLPLSDLSLAVQLFAKNIDDESLPSSIQTMSCKLLLNLVDCIRSKSEQESGNGRDVLMRMLEVPTAMIYPKALSNGGE